MRNLKAKEVKKRGCIYCIDCRTGTGRPRHEKLKAGLTHHMCIYDSCPYHELDKYKRYGDFLNSKDSVAVDIIIPRLRKRR